MKTITPVWHCNFPQEIHRLCLNLNRYKVLSVDTEFPGFLRDTPRDAPEAILYDDLKFNVDNTNIIQLGITLMDDHGDIGPTWEFNFKFDLEKEKYVQSSIEFLKKSGLDFQKIKQDGIPRNVFVMNFLKILAMHRNLKWVTFHGTYDLAHVLKLFTCETLLPNTARDFAAKASSFFNKLVDLKLAAKYSEGLKEIEVGLAKLSRILHVKRLGEAHNAGSDSLLTAQVYAKMMDHIGDGSLEGILYGLEDVRIGRMYKPRFMIRLLRPMPVQLGPCAAYNMSFRPQIPVHRYGGNYRVAPMQPQPCYFMPLPHVMM
ncbi:hypothetical protein Dsin_031028 [Dipteronia sinensis]|uniref:poly(A)-specific ribonuclease n=1 Tax=Dipteronia sinensis TaxID=43782 RepID=A0AAD9ZKS9_9ROSI|nr:hypothetical protein Dsin_031028 [Dipteronia sinensis]